MRNVIFSILFMFYPVKVFCQNLTEQEKIFTYPEFRDCGLVTRYASNKIPPQCLTEALNVLYDEDFSLSRRTGYAKYNPTPCTDQKAIKGLWSFKATDGTKYLVIFSSQTLFYSKNDGTCKPITPAINNLNPTNELNCVQALGRLWCVNGVDNAFWWDGNSTGTVTGMPKARLIDTFRNRLIIADISGELTRIRLSGEGDGTDWRIEIPGYSTSPASIDIAGTNDGQRVTCLMGEYRGCYYIGREYDMYELCGYDRRNFTLQKFSNEVGCIEQRSVREKNNCLYWLSKRGVEKFCGTTIERVSDPIRDDISGIITNAGNLRTKTYTTQQDWEAGDNLTEGPMSTTISPGDVTPSTWSHIDDTGDNFAKGTLYQVSTSVIDGKLTLAYTGSLVLYDNFEDGNYTSNPTWVCSGDCSYVGVFYYNRNYCLGIDGALNVSANLYSYDVSRAYGQWQFFGYPYYSSTLRYYFISNNSNISATNGYAISIYLPSNYPSNYTITLDRVDNGTLYQLASNTTLAPPLNYPIRIERDEDGQFRVYYGDSLIMTATDNTYSENTYRNIYFAVGGVGSQSGPEVNIDNIYNTGLYYTSGTYTSQIFDTGLSTPIGGPFNVDWEQPAGTSVSFYISYADSPTGTWSSWNAISNGQQIVAPKRYWKYKIDFATNYSTVTPSVDNVELSATTSGYYILDCVEATGITSWGNFRPTTNLDGNAKILFYVSSGTSCNQVTRSTANWVSQGENTVITVDTAPYLGIKAEFQPTSATETIKLNSLTVEWNEGESRPPVASAVYKDRYYLFFTTSTASGSYNDHAFVLDSNDKWTLFDDINAYSAVLYEGKLLTGDSRNTGYIYQQDIGIDDAGLPFGFKVKTNSFDFGEPTIRKQLKRVYLFLKSEEISGQNIDLSVKYYINGSTTAYSLNSVNLSEAPEKGYFVAKFPVPVGQEAKFNWLSLSIEYSGKQGPLYIYGIKVVYQPLFYE